MDELTNEAFSSRTARLMTVARDAADVVMALWPLASFIAANPARTLERKPFERAVRDSQRRLGGAGLLPPAVYHHFAARGLVDARRLRDTFERRVPDAGRLEVAGGDLAVRELWWRAHFEVAFGVQPASDLLAAATVAAERVPVVASADGVGADTGGQLMRRVDVLSARWVQAYCDGGQASWTLPHRERGLFHAWRTLAPIAPNLPDDAGATLARLAGRTPGRDAAQALEAALDALGVEEREWQRTLEAHLLRLPGWSSYLKWRSEQAVASTPEADALVDYLALRLCYTAALRPHLKAAEDGVPPAPRSAIDRGFVEALAIIAGDAGLDALALRGMPAQELTNLVRALERLSTGEQSLIWLEAHEETYRRDLLAGVSRHLHVEAGRVVAPGPELRPDAQLVFCIDVRSEPFRRNLEQLGNYETYGFAGFFGVPIAYRGLGEATTLDVCPALLKPRYRVTEVVSSCCAGRAQAHKTGKDNLRQLKAIASQLKSSAAACYGFVESVGFGFIVPFFAKTFAPDAYARWQGDLEAKIAPPIEVTPQLAPNEGGAMPGDASGLPYGLSLEEKIFFGEAALSVMGLTRNFARLVVLLGHASRTENNPYASALDCGACGGNVGGPSARVLAAILEDSAVREALAERGIAIPEDTHFVAGEHNTTTDEVTLYNRADLPSAHAPDLRALERSLAWTTELNCAERRTRLTLEDDGAPSAAAHATRRASDWAQVRPEWGLARNAAFIIGPRWLTAELHLEGRSFLHSYDWTVDDGGKALEIILTAPMVVAEWINTQYYFSTVDNLRFGSGSKVTHNVTGRVGVIQGNAGDLQIGLPEQSVMRREGEPYHEPLRLMTLCLAPRDRVQAIIDRNAILQQLFDHEWVALVVIDPQTGVFSRYAPNGRWLGLDGDDPVEPDRTASKAEATADHVL